MLYSHGSAQIIEFLLQQDTLIFILNHANVKYYTGYDITEWEDNLQIKATWPEGIMNGYNLKI